MRARTVDLLLLLKPVGWRGKVQVNKQLCSSAAAFNVLTGVCYYSTLQWATVWWVTLQRATLWYATVRWAILLLSSGVLFSELLSGRLQSGGLPSYSPVGYCPAGHSLAGYCLVGHSLASYFPVWSGRLQSCGLSESQDCSDEFYSLTREAISH